jgi:hypothetical protein
MKEVTTTKVRTRGGKERREADRCCLPCGRADLKRRREAGAVLGGPAVPGARGSSSCPKSGATPHAHNYKKFPHHKETIYIIDKATRNQALLHVTSAKKKLSLKEPAHRETKVQPAGVAMRVRFSGVGECTHVKKSKVMMSSLYKVF